MQFAPADPAQQAMQLVDRENRRRGIVDCLRKSLDGDVDDDPECKGRILLDGPLRPNCDLGVELMIADRGGPSIEAK